MDRNGGFRTWRQRALMRETRKLAAMLVADIVGYSRLTGAKAEDGPLGHGRQKELTRASPQFRACPDGRRATRFPSARGEVPRCRAVGREYAVMRLVNYLKHDAVSLTGLVARRE